MNPTTFLFLLAAGCGWFGFGAGDDTGSTGLEPIDTDADTDTDADADTDTDTDADTDTDTDTDDTALDTVDDDGDEWSEADGDCDDDDAEIHPGAHEACDGVDNDCDGVEDDDCFDCTLMVAIDGSEAYYSVQAAIWDAQDGDTVCVQPGTYVEEQIRNQNIAVNLVGLEGPGQTILQSAYGEDAVLYYAGLNEEVRIEGFTLTGGEVGFHAYWTSPTITLRHVTITGNSGGSNYGGAGIYAYLTHVVLSDVIVAGNHSDKLGGGLFVDGGSLAAYNLLVADNTSDANGGGMVLSGGHSVLYGVIVANNSAASYGGGLLIGGGDTDSAALVNVAVVGNSASSTGGGIHILSDHEPTLLNCEISGNIAGTTGGGIFVSSSDPGPSTIEYTNIHGNAGEPEVDNYAFVTGIWGNTSVDPEYESVSGGTALEWDLHLGALSPLIDGGDPGLLDPDGDTSDVGAYGGAQAGGWDLDGDGYPLWYQPGPYDGASYPGLGLDCDDIDAEVFPGAGC